MPQLTGEGSITVTFKPDANADPVVKEKGIRLRFNIEMSKNEAHLDDPANVVTFSNVDQNGENPVTVIVFEKYDNTAYVELTAPTGPNADGSFTYTIDHTQIMNLIALNENVKLETYKEFEAYQLLLSSYGFGITISEVPAA